MKFLQVFGLPSLLSIALSYFNLTTFFWMFAEGLYLYTLAVKTLSIDGVEIITYIFIGWGKLRSFFLSFIEAL